MWNFWLRFLLPPGIIQIGKGGGGVSVVDSVKEDLENICKTIDTTVGPEKIYLFGSYAYGVPDSNSDYDLCVVIPDGTLRPADAVKKIRRALYTQQDTPLDVVVYRTSQFQQRQGTASLERKIVREGVLLYDRYGAEQGMA
jgi:predicted nucleotidyltransferase